MPVSIPPRGGVTARAVAKAPQPAFRRLRGRGRVRRLLRVSTRVALVAGALLCLLGVAHTIALLWSVGQHLLATLAVAVSLGGLAAYAVVIFVLWGNGDRLARPVFDRSARWPCEEALPGRNCCEAGCDECFEG